ncbi:MAG: NAD(P)/FAD-dependent oxidoreductase [Fibrobacterota bacterium]|nr:NAD(P)/FAD-dependent oxidoreductase [Fibrobacterota bacterium]
MKKHVVIIGGGFGGIRAAKALGRTGKFQVTVLDRKNHHLFQPLLYQVATASLNPSDIAVPIRQILARWDDVRVHMEVVTSVDKAGKAVITESHRHPYDYLVMACGASHSYFGRNDWEDLAPGLKTVEQALEIRRRVLTAFEQAEKEGDPARQARLLTFVVIGGGPTGVELAGALAELNRTIVSKEFRSIRSHNTRVILLQGGERLLPAFDPRLSEKAKAALEKMGVEVKLDKIARDITPQGVKLDNEFIETSNVLWAAGVKPTALNKLLGVPMDREGRVIVNPDLSLPGSPEIFVIGDQAHFDTPHGPLPGLAPVAMQQGVAAAMNILRDAVGKPRKPFRYLDKGIMAVIGRSHAVTQFHGLKLSGFPAWIMWLFVHIMYLVGHRNRIIVLINWAWSYFTFKRGARLITTHTWQESDQIGLVKPPPQTPSVAPIGNGSSPKGVGPAETAKKAG